MVGSPKPVSPFTPAKPVEQRPVMPAPQAAASDAPEPEKTFLGYSGFTWSKIIPLGLMFFCILFNYTILRDTKVRLLASQRL
jgi:AAA family ATP:ADP antiporter